MIATSKLQTTPPIGGYFGGKAKSRKFIASHFPTAPALVSPFCGFAPAEMESEIKTLILNDKNPATVAALEVIKFSPSWTRAQLKMYGWGPRSFLCAKKRMESENQHDRGVAAIAYSAMAHHRGGSISGYSSQQAARAARRDWSYLHAVSERLQHARITNHDWRFWLNGHIRTDALIFLDPPYLEGGEHYQCTITTDDHAEMLERSNALPNPIIICGYDSTLYNEALKEWRRVEFAAKNNHRQDRTEVLWMNY